MKRRLIFSLCCVGILLFGMTQIMRLTCRGLLRYEKESVTELAGLGLTLAMADVSLRYTPLGATLKLTRPTLTRDGQPVWLGTTLVLRRSIMHPFSLSLEFKGLQILHPSTMMAKDALPYELGMIRFADAQAFYQPGKHRGTVSVSQLALDDTAGSVFSSIEIHRVTATLLFGSAGKKGEMLWALDVIARKPEFQTSAALPAIVSTLPTPENIHLRLVALQGDTHEWDRIAGYKSFLIQSMSFGMKGMTCSVKGRIDPRGTSDLSAHIVGLKNFLQDWLIHLPNSLRERPDYAPYLRKLHDETARIPDQMDLPVPLPHDGILLQNHISAILLGHLLMNREKSSDL